MARLARLQRYMIDVGEGENNPTLIIRRPSDKEMQRFLASRWERKGSKVVDRTIDARREFVDALLEGCERIEIEQADGTYTDLTPNGNGWKDSIPLNWKTSLAMRFEEQEAFTGDDEKNSARSSE